MTKKTTRKQQSSEKDGILYLAIELSNSIWKLGFSIGRGQRVRERNVPARDGERLLGEIGSAKRRFGLSATSKVRSCYEAGRDGFWVHHYLTSQGVENLIVDSSSIEVNRRARRAKSDRLDVQKLVGMLIRHHEGDEKVWSVVRVPSAEEEDHRQLHRELKGLKKERTRTINRIRGLLANQGIRFQVRGGASAEWIERICLWNGAGLGIGLKRRLRREWESLQWIGKQILEVEGERRQALREKREEAVAHIEKVKRLMQLRAIGLDGAWVLVEEFFGWRKFNNRREVGGLAGLTATPYNSGEMNREQGISKAGNRYVRGVMVELAWSWLRYQPRSKLARWYERRFGHGGRRARKTGIVALARRLLIDLWRYVEFGVLPEGARMKA
jgi:transposase